TLIQIIFALTNTPLNPNEPWNFIFLNNILAALCKTVPHTYANDGGTPIYFYQTSNFPIAMAFYWLHVAVLGVGVPVLGSLTFLKRDIR
nr:hypothetical protein [Bacilli bacterium]